MIRYHVQIMDFARCFDRQNSDNNSNDLAFIVERQRIIYKTVKSREYLRDLPLILDTETGELLDIFD